MSELVSEPDSTGSAAVGPPVFFRVERGTLDPVELAALTAVLCARRAAGLASAGDRLGARPAARWHRLERHRAFSCPRAWSSTVTR
jgi:hypothetical protein